MRIEAGLTEEKSESLPSGLPEGMTYVAGMTLSVVNGADPINVLPDPVTNTLSFVVPEGMKGKTFVILYWDAAAKGGLGK